MTPRPEHAARRSVRICDETLGRLLGVLLLGLTLSGCDDENGPGAGSSDAGAAVDADTAPWSPLSWTARRLVEAVIRQLDETVQNEIAGADAQEAVVTFVFIGCDIRSGLYASLAYRCEAQDSKVSAATCSGVLGSSNPCAPELDTCFVTGCSGVDRPFVEQYIANKDSALLPDDRSPITYEMKAPAGSITYDPNPLIRWQTDASNPADVRVTADLDASMVAQVGDEAIDLSHTGNADAHRIGSSIQYTIHLSMPRLLAEAPVEIEVENSDAAPEQVRITTSDATLGTATQQDNSGNPVSFTWL